MWMKIFRLFENTQRSDQRFTISRFYYGTIKILKIRSHNYFFRRLQNVINIVQNTVVSLTIFRCMQMKLLGYKQIVKNFG